MDRTIDDALVGQLLDGRYRVESRVARGGMATVYRARDTRLDRTLALKVMHSGMAEDPEFVARFIGEAKNVARLSHPNVVHVFDQGTDGRNVFLAMEYVPGRTLRHLLNERGGIGPRAAVEIMVSVLNGLAAAHRAGIVHRDVKPENVLMTGNGQVKVADFGLAKAAEGNSGQTRTGLIMGTVGYLAPERVQAGAADERSDVYAAGIMLFELLTGRQPFAGETPLAVAYNHVNSQVPAPSSLVPGLPPAVDALVGVATSRDPRRRPRDAVAMLAFAGDALGKLPPDAPPQASAAPAPPAVPPSAAAVNRTLVAPMPPTPTEARPRPGVLRGGRTWLIVALILAVLAGGLGTAWWFADGRYIRTPDVVGKPVKAAESVMRKAGFVVEVADPRHDRKVRAGRVLSTEPAPGARILDGGTVTIVPSAGPRKVPVPQLTGRSQEDAREALAAVGLEVGKVSQQGSNQPRGTVLSTQPRAGRRIAEGRKVRLVVSAGQVMPNLVGQNIMVARLQLLRFGVKVKVEKKKDVDAPPGQVVEQDPKPGTPLRPGQDVKLFETKRKGGLWNWGD